MPISCSFHASEDPNQDPLGRKPLLPCFCIPLQVPLEWEGLTDTCVRYKQGDSVSGPLLELVCPLFWMISVLFWQPFQICSTSNIFSCQQLWHCVGGSRQHLRSPSAPLTGFSLLSVAGDPALPASSLLRKPAPKRGLIFPCSSSSTMSSPSFCLRSVHG